MSPLDLKDMFLTSIKQSFYDYIRHLLNDSDFKKQSTSILACIILYECSIVTPAYAATIKMEILMFRMVEKVTIK